MTAPQVPVKPRPRKERRHPWRRGASVAAALIAATALCTVSGQQIPDEALGAGTVEVVGLGDSVMSGAHCDCAGIIATYTAIVSNRTPAEVQGVNLGVSGYTTQSVLKQLQQPDSEKVVAGSRVIAIIIGANDLLDLRQTYETRQACTAQCYNDEVTQMGSRLGSILDRVQELRKGLPTTYLVLNYWNVFQDGTVAVRDVGQAELEWSDELTRQANAVIAQQASAHHMTLVDLMPVFKGATTPLDPTNLLASDGDHPNAAGVEAIALAMSTATPDEDLASH